ncbi:predicted protein [Postia placenta Mad-698-R]|uniref:F-box domain-containing protein n=1 Tax=Postia placenta MAD-698-R-SB12 TaxID=670580 RepID=A0A1X6NAZ3_9APHY|nr:hypothetical protein POSPLADRAFT_1132412 [Postia placenta MAD-698-R-SB12]EED82059.1 predicted protein [Postia placenta Mad-698-R]OSX65744.1 hypothetical protein POSPLADRAFT_1132412 [Postia placenta MAD-698-R-SB12]
MVRPFPNEIWLDIFHGFAKEGEYDTLERCRVVCREFKPMAEECLEWSMIFKNVENVERIKVDVSGGILRRWSGPERVFIEGGNSEDERRRIPHLATFASRLAGRWLRIRQLWIINAVWRARDLDLDAVVRDLAASAIRELHLYDVIFPSILTLGRLICALPRLEKLALGDVQFTLPSLDAGTISRFHLLPHSQLEALDLGPGHGGLELRPSFVELVDLMAVVSKGRRLVPPLDLAQVSPWSAVRWLTLGAVTFPSVTTFARLLCALPALEGLVLHGSYVFVKHGLDLRRLPVHPGLPLHLADVELPQSSRYRLDPCSVADLVDLFIATGISERLRRIASSLPSSPRVTTACDAALNRLVKHSQSLRHLSFEPYLMMYEIQDADEWVHVDHSAAPYFDVSGNPCLERLDLAVDVDRENLSHPCAPVVEILSQVTSAHLSRIQVDFQPVDPLGVKLDVYLRKLMDGLPQLDAMFSQPFFKNLTDVIIYISTLDGPNVQDEESAHGLRLCLPMLDARGILGIRVNNVETGLHQDMETREWRCHKIEKASAQDAVVTDAGAGADDDKRTNNATTVTIPHEDSDMVPAVSQPAWVPPAMYADAETPSSSTPTDARIPVELACDDKFVLHNATAGPGTSLDKFARDDGGDKLSAEPGTSAQSACHDERLLPDLTAGSAPRNLLQTIMLMPELVGLATSG